MIELIGWTGALLLAGCGLPLVIASFKDPQVARSTPLLFLHCWFWGEILLLLYSCITLPSEEVLPILVNYSVNIMCILIVFMLRYKNRS